MLDSGTPETSIPQAIVAQPAPVMINQPSQQTQHNPYVNQAMVDPITAFLRTIKSWSGEGRAQRSEYWFGGIAYSFCIGIAFFILTIPVSFFVMDSGANDTDFVLFLLLMLAAVVFIILYIPILSQTIRRLHDAGYSGWFIALGLIPYVGGIILFVFCVLPTQPHPNKFG